MAGFETPSGSPTEGIGVRLNFPSKYDLGAVHKVRHAIFGQIWPLCHTFSHIPGPPKVRHTFRTPLRFLVGLVQRPRAKAPCTNSLSIVRGGFCLGVFCLEGFVRGAFCPFPLLSEYICYNRKLNITLNIMFHMYDKKIYKRDVVTSSWPPSLCHKLSHLFDWMHPRLKS